METTIAREKVRALYMGKYEENKGIVDARIAEGIEKNRKGNCRVCIVDENGIPQAEKRVKITQLTHDFKFGANLFLLDEFESEAENAEYRKLFKEHFNLATVPFYWDTLEPDEGSPRYAANSAKIYRRPAPDLCVKYCEDAGITPKLHCIFYDKFSPEWLKRLDLEMAKAKLEKRIQEIAQRYAGKMFEFEVTNEQLLHVWKTKMGGWKDIVPWCFETVRKYLPNEQLTINDATHVLSIVTYDYYSPYYLQCDGLISKGVSLDRIGMQNHLFTGVSANTQEEYDESVTDGYTLCDPLMYYRVLDVMAELGKPLEITEVTVPTFGTTEEDEALQADILRMWMSIWFSHPAVDCVIYWNTVDNCTYADEGWNENNCRGGLWHRDLTPKKSAKMLKKMIQEEWHTDIELTTDKNGYVEFRGFYGDYIAKTGEMQMEFGLHK